MSQFAIEIEGITKNYPGVRALKNVHLQVPKGSVFGLLGPNGAGKTTLVRILLGFSFPSEGTCHVLGKVPSVSLRSRIGFLPERMAIPTFLTGREFLEYSLRLAFVPKLESISKAKELLQSVGLESAGDRRVSTYSKGMLQRLGLANALGAEPELLLLDEPGTGLDPVGYKEFRETILRENQKRGVTILLNSHRLAEVEQICTDIAILHKGHLKAQGKLNDLKQGKDRLRIRLGAEQEEVALLLREIAIEWKQDGKEWEIKPKPDVDLRTLPSRLVDRGADLMLYERSTESLEELFIRLTTNEAIHAESREV
ncbi:ABC transporter ATP-binding protein [Leptospira perolatii]|uniref:ABC transporter ATP-binding protein n=1 Tax=Leptospira perolatii TaxID=2023191 RepID=A0A2M9ZSY9_9LEPT|nr:ABC transporter ATP-binding protein [Leptospira perolatii]PJZ71597.1 ABC transporter ATP-binding protein [Leptospira perolatii]PJZ75212.1 ABC transporter ATP-binding protein [Leptospira perolatii]